MNLEDRLRGDVSGHGSARLNERIVDDAPEEQALGVDSRPAASVDPYAGLKTRIHAACIAQVGPAPVQRDGGRPHRGARRRPARSSRRRPRPLSAADRVRLVARDHGRHPGLRPAGAVPPRRLRQRGHGQRAGPRLRRACRQDREDRRRVRRRSAPRADHREDRLAGRPARRRGVADGRRSPARRQPRQRDPAAALPERADADDPQVRTRPVHDRRPDRVRHADREGGELPRRLRAGAAQRAHLRRHRHRQDDAAERPLGLRPRRRAHRHDRGRGRAAAAAAARRPARDPPGEHRGQGRGADPRPRAQRPAHAARPDHRRRGPRRRVARHAPGDEHRATTAR